MLEHFGELPPDMVERKQYAFWKAADIRKALREGRKPEPGPPEKDELDLDLPDTPGAQSKRQPSPAPHVALHATVRVPDWSRQCSCWPANSAERGVDRVTASFASRTFHSGPAAVGQPATAAVRSSAAAEVPPRQ